MAVFLKNAEMGLKGVYTGINVTDIDLLHFCKSFIYQCLA